MKAMKHLLLGLSLIAFAGGAALAADESKPASSTTGATTVKSGAKEFSQLDKDNDGYISRSEAAADPTLQDKFKAADKDNDGKLSRTEYDAVQEAAQAGGSAPAASKPKQ